MIPYRFHRSIAVLLAVVAPAACAAGGGGEERLGRLDLGSATQATRFAPGVVSTAANDDLHPAFMPDGGAVYFVRRVPDGRFTIHVSRRLAGGDWSEPTVASFSGEFEDQEPFVSADGERFYYTSDRPLAGGEPLEGRDAWVAHAAGDGWGPPRPVEGARLRVEPPDREGLSRFWGRPRGPMEGPDGALYFWAERPDALGHTDIYRAARGDGGFAEPANLGPPINSEFYETGMVVAPDGGSIVFGRDAAEDGYGRGDLYVSVRDGDGWTEPRNLGSHVNSDQYDYSPRFSPGGRYLFFSSNRNPAGEGPGRHDIYYIEVEALAPDGPGPAGDRGR